MKTQIPMPPKLARELLLLFLRSDLIEEVTGDLEERFYAQVRTHSLFRSKLDYWFQVFNYLRPFAIRKSSGMYANQLTMYRSYFKIGWRNLLRHKMYSVIKVGGFAVGIAACLLIALFLQQELSYDKHYKNGDRIFRVIRETAFRGEYGMGVHFPAPLTNALREDYPVFEKVGHYNPVGNFGAGENELRRQDREDVTHEEGFAYADQELLEILEVPVISGSPTRALTEPNTMVITQRKADKYFPNEDPIGKVFILNNNEDRQYTVTGVIADFPVSSHFKYDFLMTLAGQEFWNGEQSNWQASNYINYVLIREGTNIADTEQMMGSLLKNHFIPFAVKNGGAREEMDWINSMRFMLQPVQEIYLNKDDMFDGSQHGDIRYNWLFSAIAVFILMIACVNFINLSTARSAGRAREVGLRKVVGSLRSSLVNQFLTESVLFSLFSFILGALLAWVFLPYFNTLMQRSLIFPWNAWWFAPVIAVGALFVGIFSGAYPAFYLSSFQPAQALKGNTSGAGRNTKTRSLLVVFQFTISIILIVGTLVINRQMDYIMNKKLGFDKEQVLLLEGAHTLGDQVIVFKNELLRLPQVQYASISSYLPVTGSQRNGGGMWVEGMTDEEKISSQHWYVDHDYIKTMGLKILKGRDFAAEIPSDSQAMVVNESLVKALQLKEPIGTKIFNWLGGWTVIGVIEDFHSETMRRGIEPMGLFIRNSPNTVSVKLNSTDMQAAISAVTKVWNAFSPHQSIRYSFLDQRYEHMYADVKRMGWMFASFAILAIAVACLGLFALSAFMVEQRGKEICIRLVLGATLQNIFGLLTLNFVRLVLVSITLAVPLAWYVAKKWLEDFSYRIEITWDVFALAGVAAILITLLTISFQSIRAALMNPVDGLRSE